MEPEHVLPGDDIDDEAPRHLDCCTFELGRYTFSLASSELIDMRHTAIIRYKHCGALYDIAIKQLLLSAVFNQLPSTSREISNYILLIPILNQPISIKLLTNKSANLKAKRLEMANPCKCCILYYSENKTRFARQIS